mgnify:CR=1 FL=1
MEDPSLNNVETKTQQTTGSYTSLHLIHTYMKQS